MSFFYMCNYMQSLKLYVRELGLSELPLSSTSGPDISLIWEKLVFYENCRLRVMTSQNDFFNKINIQCTQGLTFQM